MTNDTDTTPGDLAGSVREVQHQLRERYGATEAEVDADDLTEWEEHLDGETELIGRDEDLTITLRWHDPDLPLEPGKGAVASHIEILAGKIERVQEDFPEADVSTYASRTRAQLNIGLGDS